MQRRYRPRGSDVSLGFKVSKFLAMPARFKYLALAQRFRRLFPSLPIPIRLPFGAWWLAENSALDFNLSTIGFENAEILFVSRFLLFQYFSLSTIYLRSFAIK